MRGSFFKRLIGFGALVAAVITAGGCATADLVASHTLEKWLNAPTVVEATFKVAPDVNPDPYGDAQAIWVRVYMLKSMGTFESADIFQFRDQDEDLLAKDLKLRELLSFEPGEEAAESFMVPVEETPEEELFFGVVAGYRDWGNAEWRAVAPIPVQDTTPVVVHLDRLAVRLFVDD